MLLLLVILILLVFPSSIYATEIRNVPIECTVASTFTVRLPTQIELTKQDGAWKYTGTVGAKGDLQTGSHLKVIPDESITLWDVTLRPTNDLPSNSSDQLYKHKAERLVTVSQNTIAFGYSDINAINYTDTELTLLAGDMEAGKWRGNLAFEICISDADKVYSTVAEMLQDDTLNTGMLTRTKGYYTDGVGAGRYLITDSADTPNGGTILRLQNGLYAKLLVNAQTVDVTQFGAYADGMHNDSSAIEAALNSGVANVTFTNNAYKCCNPIKIKTNNVNIMGNSSVIFTDNDYQTSYYEWFFNVMASDINIDNLQFEARETITPQRKSQMGVMYASNVKITNCIFNIPNTVLADAADKNCEYTNLDLYTSWNNVTVDNCEFYDLADCLAGGCLEIRDIKGYDCRGCTFTNNVCYANNHDEIMGVFCLSDYNRVFDVEIKGNEFYQTATTMYNRAVGLSLGYSGAHGSGATNVLFEDNYYSGNSHFEFIKFGKSENVIVRNNELICELDEIENPDMCLFRCADSSNVLLDSNDLRIKEKAGKSLLAISRGVVKFDNNDIICDLPFTNNVFDGVGDFTNNRLTFNKAFSRTIFLSSVDGVDISSNIITLNSWGNNFINLVNLRDIVATEDITINDNTINFHNLSSTTKFLLLSSVNMQDHVLNCRNNNIIDADSDSAVTAFLCHGSMVNKQDGQLVLDNNIGPLTKLNVTSVSSSTE